MFTGIITAIGKVVSIEANANQRALVLETPYTDVKPGESVALNGVCLTATEAAATGCLKFFVSSETCERSNLGALEAGDAVNLERALCMGDRLSGHLVQGHVDGRASLTLVEREGECYRLEVELPARLARYTAEKGSIAFDGVSLTINSVRGSVVSVMIIPHTWQHTTLSRRKVGDYLNVELDMIAKHVENLVAPYLAGARAGELK